jgi:hypothetical protein
LPVGSANRFDQSGRNESDRHEQSNQHDVNAIVEPTRQRAGVTRRAILRIGDRILAHGASRCNRAVERDPHQNDEIEKPSQGHNILRRLRRRESSAFPFQPKGTRPIRDAASG